MPFLAIPVLLNLLLFVLVFLPTHVPMPVRRHSAIPFPISIARLVLALSRAGWLVMPMLALTCWPNWVVFLWMTGRARRWTLWIPIALGTGSAAVGVVAACCEARRNTCLEVRLWFLGGVIWCRCLTLVF